jgi:hypothetical protein
VNLLVENIDATKKNTETLLMLVGGWSINTRKTKYMVYIYVAVSNVGHHCHIEIANRSFENVAKFKCLGIKVTNQNLIQEEIKRGLNLGTACYHPAENH